MAAFDQRYFTAPSLPGIHIFGSCGSRNSHARTVSHAASGYRDQRVTAWLLRVFLSRTGLYAVVLLLAVLSLTTTNNARISVSDLYDDERGDSPHNFSTASVGSTFSRVESGVLFREKPLVLWTSDFHIATIRDIQDLMKPMGVSFIDRSLTPRCHFHDNCANSSNLKVITRSNGLNLEAPLIDEFYNVYKDDPLIKTVDAFVCYHPTAMCQLYKPFDKSLVVMASTRFELGRFEPDRWQQWIDDLIEIAADPKSFVGANNEYDANYIQYFTGLKVPVIPSYCGYTEASYNPIKPGFLTFAGRNPPSYHHKFFRKEYEATFRRRNSSEDLQFKHFRSVYNTFEFQDLANHQGVIFVPYQQWSVEFDRMNGGVCLEKFIYYRS
ncbi:hypothetical protein CAPTEDRAFT_190836 [Capitella teleta]|uniref:Uncharacterized protein n=1 Tax=Capitella teleta TaxID=283909 RepID=R7U4K4_CAPTE|nr:hypothetical protein CAPTEDRAFT_190836 [Capitella teleta]|eukprot:ELT98621.1 hypothetical protein CAPTEDRAFT_190836 [Capitella teleta]